MTAKEVYDINCKVMNILQSINLINFKNKEISQKKINEAFNILENANKRILEQINNKRR